MALQSSGEITIDDLNIEFTKLSAQPNGLGNFYRGGGLVPDGDVNINVPTSGQIELSDFYGATNIVLGYLEDFYAHSAQRENDYRGYRQWYTYPAKTSRIIRLRWDPYYQFHSGHWNGNVSQHMQIRTTNNDVIFSFSLGGLNPPWYEILSTQEQYDAIPDDQQWRYRVAPEIHDLPTDTIISVWTSASTRTGPPYGVMSARGWFYTDYEYVPSSSNTTRADDNIPIDVDAGAVDPTVIQTY